jgi:uncharacterized membrane protein HdeD (DUF308 family)
MSTEKAVAGIVGLFARSWWVVFLRGVVAIVFGILAFAWPGVTWPHSCCFSAYT